MLTIFCTEDKKRGVIEDIFSKYFDGFTVIEGCGMYHGEMENSIQIQVATQDEIPEAVTRQICERVKGACAQECVLVIQIPAVIQFI